MAVDATSRAPATPVAIGGPRRMNCGEGGRAPPHRESRDKSPIVSRCRRRKTVSELQRELVDTRHNKNRTERWRRRRNAPAHAVIDT